MEVELKGIHKRYGRVQANQDVSLKLEPGRIYGLLGENGAGKSTLMRILAGHTRPDSGEIVFSGRKIERLTPSLALRQGVGMLYQDPSDFPALTVWENFSLGGRTGTRPEAARRLKELGTRLGFHLDPEARVGELTVGERQQLEIMRLLDAGAKVLILDEPTTGITLAQKDVLFSTLRRLSAEEGRIVIIVTHKLSDAVGLCHHLMVMRHGRMIARLDPPFDPENLVQVMFGPEASESSGFSRPEIEDRPGFIRLEGADLAGEKFTLSGINLEIRPGEIIGLAGLEGAGQTVLLKGLAGLVRMPAGRLMVGGRNLSGRTHRLFRREGIHFLPASRLEEGLFPDLCLTDHICLAFPEQRGRLKEFYEEECVARFSLKAPPETAARSLSGGNQQRLLLSLIPGRTRLLLMEHPTRGLDFGSARQVWEHLESLCRAGAAVVFSSADLDEIFQHSSRILVFYNQSLVADLPADQTGVEEVGGLMAGRDQAA